MPSKNTAWGGSVVLFAQALLIGSGLLLNNLCSGYTSYHWKALAKFPSVTWYVTVLTRNSA